MTRPGPDLPQKCRYPSDLSACAVPMAHVRERHGPGGQGQSAGSCRLNIPGPKDGWLVRRSSGVG
jgi:hypothetical protein